MPDLTFHVADTLGGPVNSAKPGKPNLVVVDDEQDNVDLMIRSLSANYRVHGFTTPTDVPSAIVALDPLALVCDYRMPGMTGVDLVRAVRRRGLRVAIVIVTAFSDTPEIVEATRRKLAYHVLQKPWSPQDLTRHVEMAISSMLYQVALEPYLK